MLSCCSRDILGTGGLHAIDFAGGSVVHELAAAAALPTAFYLKRSQRLDRPHNVPLVLLGAGILWSGSVPEMAVAAGASNGGDHDQIAVQAAD